MADTFETQGVEILLVEVNERAQTPNIALAETKEDDDEPASLPLSTSPSSKATAPKRLSKAQAKRSRKEANRASNSHSNPPLRPASDILSRIRYDTSLNEDDFVIGYLDRHESEPLEMDVSAWKGADVTDEEWIPQHRIMYFRRKDEGKRKVWERARRLDRIFGSGVPEEEGEEVEPQDAQGDNTEVDEGGGNVTEKKGDISEAPSKVINK